LQKNPELQYCSSFVSLNIFTKENGMKVLNYTFLITLVLFTSMIHAREKIVSTSLAYDDVLLIPQCSAVKSRRDVSTTTQLTKNIQLNVPIISTNMDTVTEAKMEIAMAQMGGIGIIHRFNSIEEQVAQVRKVKRFTNAVIEQPLTIHPDDTIEKARYVMQKNGITSLLVTDNKNKLVGILTKRDMWFPENVFVSDRMTPKDKLIVGYEGMELKEARNTLLKHRIEKLPILKKDGSIAGLITSKDIDQATRYPNAALDSKRRLLVGAAIGVKEYALLRAEQLIEAGVDVLVIDIAHGHSNLAIGTLMSVKEHFPDIDVIAGNVACQDGVRDLILAGADCVKVGVGPGSICTTRITTGAGYPQFSAVLACGQEAAKYNVPIIADGGIRTSGDIAKALAAGAHTVMLGSMLAGTEESPGLAFIKNGKRYKVVRGMASFGAKLGREVNENNNTKLKDVEGYVPEGTEAMVPFKGSVVEIIHQLLGGLRSGMSYCGATTIEALHEKSQFVRITGAGQRESGAHDVIPA